MTRTRSISKVVFFDAYPHVLGGAQRATLLLATELQARGWEVTVTTPESDGPYPAALTAAGLAHRPVPLPRPLRLYGGRTRGRRAVAAGASLPPVWGRLARDLRARADVVHAIDHRGLLLSGPAARMARRPVVWHVHSASGGPAVNRLCAAVADATVVADRSLAGSLPSAQLDRAVEIPNPLPEQVLAWDPVPAAEGRYGPGPLRLVTVGRLHPEKGYDTLVDAVAVLCERGQTVRLRIVCGPQDGDGPHRRALLERIARLGVGHTVELVGPVEDVYPELAAADVYVQPSLREVQPLAVLEAMAAGLPVVASAVGALPALLDGGRRGRLVPAADPLALAAAVAEVALDPRSADRAAAARHHVHARCRPAAAVDAVEALYRSL